MLYADVYVWERVCVCECVWVSVYTYMMIVWVNARFHSIYVRRIDIRSLEKMEYLDLHESSIPQRALLVNYSSSLGQVLKHNSGMYVCK